VVTACSLARAAAELRALDADHPPWADRTRADVRDLLATTDEVVELPGGETVTYRIVARDV